MSPSTHAQAQGTPVDHELIIKLEEGFPTVFLGTSSQLLDEGLIPDGFEWPAHRGVIRWSSDGMQCRMHRARPPGATAREWHGADWWRLARSAVTGKSCREQNMDAAERALARAAYAVSPAGRRIPDLAYAARCDKAYCRFLGKVPALAREYLSLASIR